MKQIDLNCDLGESEDGSDLDMMPHISSCNIACGGHAGDRDLMHLAVKEAIKHGVSIGAHPGYPDKKHFGRVSPSLAVREIASIVSSQIDALQSVVAVQKAQIGYVKLHGALYHDAAKYLEIAEAVFIAMKQINPKLGFLGLKGTFHEHARKHGLNFYAESFADRRYDANGRLVSRSFSDAVLINESEVVEQVMGIIDHFVVAQNGKNIAIMADSICIHGDHPRAEFLVRIIKSELIKNDVALKSFLV